MRAVFIIARKELAQRLRDKTFFIIGLAAPLILAFIFNLILGGVVGPNPTLTFAFGVVNEDAGVAGERFETMLGGMEEEGFVALTRYETRDEAQAAVDEGDVDAVFILPGELAADFGAELTVLGNVDAEIGQAVAIAIADEFARRARIGSLAVRAAFEVGAIGPEAIGAAIAETAEMQLPLQAVTVEVRSRQVQTTTFFIAGLGIFFTFFIVGLSVTSMLEEKSNGTLARLVAAPIRPAAIVAGKTLASIVLGLVSMLFLMIASTLIMGADWGNPLAAFGVVAATVVAAAGIMTFAGALARSAEQAGNLQSIVALTMAMLGGTFVPIAAEEGLLNTLRYLTPNAWYLRGLGDVAGEAYGEALMAVAILLAIGAVFGAIGLTLVRRTVRP